MINTFSHGYIFTTKKYERSVMTDGLNGEISTKGRSLFSCLTFTHNVKSNRYAVGFRQLVSGAKCIVSTLLSAFDNY